nr:MAG TPA: hypothetical protein [Caudoviricetes sp.]
MFYFTPIKIRPIITRERAYKMLCYMLHNSIFNFI